MQLQHFLDSVINTSNQCIDKEFSKQVCQTITFSENVVGDYILAIDQSENIVSGSLSTPNDYYVFNTPDEEGIWVDTLDDFIIKINQLFSTGKCDDLVTISFNIDDETKEQLTKAAAISGVTIEEFVIKALTDLVNNTK